MKLKEINFFLFCFDFVFVSQIEISLWIFDNKKEKKKLGISFEKFKSII